MNRIRVVAADEDRRVAVALEQLAELLLRDPREHRRIGDLVAIQVQDRQDGAIAARVQELVRVPARSQRPGLGLAVPDDAEDNQVRVVEGRTVGVHQRIAELPAFVYRSWRLGCDVARYAAWKRELPEQLLHAGRGRARIPRRPLKR